MATRIYIHTYIHVFEVLSFIPILDYLHMITIYKHIYIFTKSMHKTSVGHEIQIVPRSGLVAQEILETAKIEPGLLKSPQLVRWSQSCKLDTQASRADRDRKFELARSSPVGRVLSEGRGSS